MDAASHAQAKSNSARAAGRPYVNPATRKAFFVSQWTGPDASTVAMISRLIRPGKKTPCSHVRRPALASMSSVPRTISARICLGSTGPRGEGN